MDQFTHQELQHVIRKYDAEFKKTKRQLNETDGKLKALIEENKELDEEKANVETELEQ